MFNFITARPYIFLGQYDEALAWIKSLPPEEQSVLQIWQILHESGRYTEAEPYRIQAEQELLSIIDAPISHIFTKSTQFATLIYIYVVLKQVDKAKHYLVQALNVLDNPIYSWVILLLLEQALDLFIAIEDLERSVEITSLIIHHPKTFPFVCAKAQQRIDNLQSSLPRDKYVAAWERGKSRELGAVVTELIAEYSDTVN